MSPLATGTLAVLQGPDDTEAGLTVTSVVKALVAAGWSPDVAYYRSVHASLNAHIRAGRAQRTRWLDGWRYRAVEIPDGPEISEGRQAFRVVLPCPTCGNDTVIGYMLVNEQRQHMHTRYVCTFWSSSRGSLQGPGARCGWEGWAVLGWDRQEAPA